MFLALECINAFFKMKLNVSMCLRHPEALSVPIAWSCAIKYLPSECYCVLVTVCMLEALLVLYEN
jgi:hypothetical protein